MTFLQTNVRVKYKEKARRSQAVTLNPKLTYNHKKNEILQTKSQKWVQSDCLTSVENVKDNKESNVKA